MKALSFLGLFAVTGLFGLTYILNYQGCYNWSCECSLTLSSRNNYLFVSLAFAVFFLIYCVLFLFKISELTTIINKETSDRLLDASLVQGTYSIYELPVVKLITKLGFVLSFALLGFAFAMSNLTCEAQDACNLASCTSRFSYDEDIYLLGYGASGAYFMVLTLVGLLKSYPSKY